MISFVCGQLCSGKTLYSKALAHICEGVYIEVGDIVRSLKQTQDRKLLQDSSNLTDQIINKLIVQLTDNPGKDLIVSGVRQKEIVKPFPKATLLWVECPVNERKRRYESRSREGDSQTFEEAEQGDIDLGILEVKNYIFNQL
jgi:cytidylate kinase